jgi:hypothetical protein
LTVSCRYQRGTNRRRYRHEALRRKMSKRTCA